MHFRAYLDESYDWGSRKLFVFAGIYGDERPLSGLASAWQQVLLRHGVNSFHAKTILNECARVGASPEKLAGELAQLVSKADGVYPVACRLDLSKYDDVLIQRFQRARRIPRGRSVSGSLGNPWYLAFQFAIERTIEEARNNSLLCGGDKIDFVFDRQKEFQGRSVVVSADTRADDGLPFSRWLGEVSFGSRNEIVELQVADFIASEVLKEEVPWSTGRPLFTLLMKRSQGICQLPAEAIYGVLQHFENRSA